ncbi:MAG: membrane-associated PAP2 superfamily phosphatase [Oceanicoccus sp.]|jgi:membrane-associated PAP2 superfamily phosphatase
MFDFLLKTTSSLNRQRCFPAGHLSGGFSLPDIIFYMSKKEKIAVGPAVIIRSVMGRY